MWYLYMPLGGDLAPLQLKSKVCITFCWFMSLGPAEGTEWPQVLLKQVGGQGAQCLPGSAYN